MEKVKLKSIDWVALNIGNSGLHWGHFRGEELQSVWDSEHISTSAEFINEIPPILMSQSDTKIPLYIASVVPKQTVIWKSSPQAQFITLEHIPLKNIYGTMGVDRALTLWGAAGNYGLPCLVIDAGTALTFTGANLERALVGGAIMPGISLQLKSLAFRTGALTEIEIPQTLPSRWANNTPEAMASGVIYTLLAGVKDFINDWLDTYSDSKIIFTGGGGELLYNYLESQDLGVKLIHDKHLIFWGIRSLLFD